MKTDEFFNEVRAAIDEQFHCVAQGGVLVHQEQHQIECGAAFCEYLFKLIRYCHGTNVTPRIFGVAAYRPQKGKTSPRIKFSAQGQYAIWRADWLIEGTLPLSELVRAAEECDY